MRASSHNDETPAALSLTLIGKDVMKNATMRTLHKVCLLVFVLAAPALAQNWVANPSPAAAGPVYDVSVGYTNFNMAIPGAGRTNLSGVDVSGVVDFRSRLGMTVDTNYARTSSILGTAHGGYALTFLGGPVFYPFERGSTRVFTHFLAGLGLVDGAAPESETDYRYGWQRRFSYAAGLGVEHSVAGPLSLRVGADYLHTSFFDFSGRDLPQNNFRMTVSAVFRLPEHQHKVVVP